MAYDILQSSTQAPLLFFLVASSDHITGLTGATPTVTLSKAGGAFASPAGAVTEMASGWYKVAGNATDTATLGPLALHATATSGDPCDIIVANIVSYNPQDAVRLGLTALPNAAAGAASGLHINGVNSGTTTFGPVVVSGAFTLTGGMAITQSAANTAGVSIAGNGTAAGLDISGGATGIGFKVAGGATSGDGLSITTVSGNAITATASGSSKHGMQITGGTAGTSDGIKAVAGTGGVDIRGNITGNITGTLSSLSLRKNVALNNFEFLMTDSTNHNPLTGLAVTVTRSIDNGAFAAGTLSAVTEVGSGIYSVNFGAGDLNGNVITLLCTATGADNLYVTFVTNQ